MLNKMSLGFVWLMFSFCLIQCLKAVSKNDDQFLIARGYIPEKPEEFGKYIVDVRYMEDARRYGSRHRCVASILSRYAVLTIAVCVLEPKRPYKILAMHMQLVAGSTKKFEKTPHTRFYKIKQILLHPKYEYRQNFTHLHAAAIIRPSVPIEIIKGFTEIISMSPERALEGKLNCILIGWGSLFNYGPVANELVQGDAEILPNEDCASTYEDFHKENMICATGNQDKSPYLDTCQQDGGAPLFCDGLLYGISLFGFDCGVGYDSMFLDTAAYTPWIMDHIKEYPKIFVN